MSDLVLTELVVSGFKTLVEDVRIPLAPGITVLVGANNSGKSNVLALLKLLNTMARLGSLEQGVAALGGAGRVATRGGNRRLAASVRGRIGGAEFLYLLDTKSEVETISVERAGTTTRLIERTQPGAMNDNGVPVRLDQPLPPGGLLLESTRADYFHLWQKLVGIQVCELLVPSLRREAVLEAYPTLGPDGLSIAAVLDVLRDTRPEEFESLVDEVRRSAPEIKQLVFPPGAQPGTKVLGVHETRGEVFRAAEISDGVLLLIGLTTVAQLGLGGPANLLALEEPDRGIHPRRIRDVVDQLRRVAARGCQVVLTTHSPILLDEFRDEPESILLLDRDERGTRVSRLSDHPDVEDMLRGRSLGDLWYSGLLGGVPARSTGAG